MGIVTQVICADLWCKWCSADTIHVVLYVGPQIKEISCTSCHMRLTVSTQALRRRYVDGLPNRARAFASDALAHFYRHPAEFVTHIPQHVILKALELSAELYAVLAQRAEARAEAPAETADIP